MSKREACVLFIVALACIAAVGVFLIKALTAGGFQ